MHARGPQYSMSVSHMHALCVREVWYMCSMCMPTAKKELQCDGAAFGKSLTMRKVVPCHDPIRLQLWPIGEDVISRVAVVVCRVHVHEIK